MGLKVKWVILLAFIVSYVSLGMFLLFPHLIAVTLALMWLWTTVVLLSLLSILEAHARFHGKDRISRILENKEESG
jgi:hypothetical protein